MLRIDSQSLPFTACWNEGNIPLNPNRGGVLENTIRKIGRFIFFIPNCIVAACINPRGETRFYPSPKLAADHGSFRKEIITPDQVHLTANVYISEGAASMTPTVILFNQLGTNESLHYRLQTNLTSRKCNVITFDYRGCGNTRRPEDLTLDGESVYQYVTEELGTHRNQVYFFGYSLGGAIGAQVKALHPESEGKYVGDRPFKSLFSLITENVCIERFGRLIKKITSFVSSILLAYPLYLLGWEWDGTQAWANLKGDKRIVYHPNDYLVPFEASFASLCLPEQLVRLNPDATGPSTHFSPLANHNTADGLSAVTVIADFLSQ